MTMNIANEVIMTINAAAMAAVIIGGFVTIISITVKDIVSFVKKRI